MPLLPYRTRGSIAGIAAAQASGPGDGFFRRLDRQVAPRPVVAAAARCGPDNGRLHAQAVILTRPAAGGSLGLPRPRLTWPALTQIRESHRFIVSAHRAAHGP